MQKAIVIGLLSVFFSGVTFAQTWKGEFYNIVPRHPGVTVDFCKAHVLDTYYTTPQMVDKTVKAENGLTAHELGFNKRIKGGILLRDGVALISGVESGKPWETKIYYFGQSLEPRGGAEQGAWYTADCKGFYRVGPG